jgi:hypothetical protein
MKAQHHNRFPSARHSGTITLALLIGSDVVSGSTVRDFLTNILRFLDDRGLLETLVIPFGTTGANNLVSRDALHPDGRPFAVALCYRSSSGDDLYININQPRFFALRQGARLLEAVGLKASPL